MKKIVLSLLVVLVCGCSKNCDNEITTLNEQRIKAIGYCNGSQVAINKVNSDFDTKLAELMKKCN
jgi:hypothetical protein